MVRPVRGALSSAHSAHRTPTNRARVRAHLLMVAVAAQHVLVRVHFFRLTPAPPDRRLELALTRAGYGTSTALHKFSFHPTGGSVPRIQRAGFKCLITAFAAFFKPPHQITTTNPLFPASFEQTQRVPTGHPDVCPCDVCGATKNVWGLPSFS